MPYRIYKDIVIFDADDEVTLEFTVDKEKRTTSTFVELNGTSITEKPLGGSFTLHLGAADSINRVEIYTDLVYLEDSDASGIIISFSPVPQKGQQSREVQTQDDSGSKGEHTDYKSSFKFYE